MKVIFGTDPVKYPLTGIGRYSFELANALAKRAEITNLLFLNGYKISKEIPVAKECRSSFEGMKSYLKKNKVLSELYRYGASLRKANVLRKYPDTIYHGPNFYMPPGVKRSVVTFHDLSVFTLSYCHPTERVRYMRKELLNTVKRADVFITDSEFTRLELIDYFNLPESRVFSARLACSEDFKPYSESRVTPVLEKYRLSFKQYTFFLGSIEPRKNISTLLDAYERLPLSLRQSIPLVISGFEGWNSDKIHQRFDKGKREGWLRYLGFTSSVDVPALYAGAISFLFPSIYEGFGLPVLEAMASGTPVVCSNSSSLPEVVGECALMCDAMDVETLTTLIMKSFDDKIWQSFARQSGLVRAKQFSWERCASETIIAYEQVK